MKTYDQDTDKVGGTVKMTGSRPRGPYCPNSGSVLLDTDVKRQRPRVSSQFFPRGQGPGSRAFPHPGSLLRVLRALLLHSSGEAVPSWGLLVLFGRNAQCCPCALPPPLPGGPVQWKPFPKPLLSRDHNQASEVATGHGAEGTGASPPSSPLSGPQFGW